MQYQDSINTKNPMAYAVKQHKTPAKHSIFLLAMQTINSDEYLLGIVSRRDSLNETHKRAVYFFLIEKKNNDKNFLTICKTSDIIII